MLFRRGDVKEVTALEEMSMSNEVESSTVARVKPQSSGSGSKVTDVSVL